MEIKSFAPDGPGAAKAAKLFDSLPVRGSTQWAPFGEAFLALAIGGLVQVGDAQPTELRTYLKRRGLADGIDFEVRGEKTVDEKSGEVTATMAIAKRLSNKKFAAAGKPGRKPNGAE